MPSLSLQKNARRLRIYIGESDRWRGGSLDAALLEMIRSRGLAGATVFRGMAGFGARSFIHTSQIEVLSADLPVVIEVIDAPEKIDAILDVVYPMVREGMITVEDVQIVKYTHRFLNPLPADRLVSEAMTKDVTAASLQTPVRQVWEWMLEKELKAVPVLDAAGKPVGMITDEDLLERAGIQQRLSIAVRMEAEDINREMQRLETSTTTAADVMSKPIITASGGETLGIATARMVKSGLKRLPVVNEDGKLIGMLSRLDILRQAANATFQVQAKHLPKGAVKIIKDVMSKKIPMVNQDDDLATIIEKFARSNSNRLIVVDSEGKPSGLISDSDVVARVQSVERLGILAALKNIGKPKPGKETAFDIMSPGVLTGPADLPVIHAIRLMLSEGRKWLVVVDESGKPLGLVDRQILLEAIAAVHPGGKSPSSFSTDG